MKNAVFILNLMLDSLAGDHKVADPELHINGGKISLLVSTEPAKQIKTGNYAINKKAVKMRKLEGVDDEQCFKIKVR